MDGGCMKVKDINYKGYIGEIHLACEVEEE